MKNIYLIILICSLVIGCNKNSDADLTGEWKLIEQLIDPGDGSGTYVEMESDKTIVFKSNGEFTCNGDICTINGESEISSYGIVNADKNTITGTGCMSEALFDIGYSFEEGNLILTFPCFESCFQKFEKIN
jgi:hypothetical protein